MNHGVKLVPQVDRISFFPIVYWTFIIYVGGYLFLSATFLFSFFAQLKLMAKRMLTSYLRTGVLQHLTGNLGFFAWIAI